MNDHDLDLQLLEGSPIHIDDVGFFYVPSLREIAKINYSVYSQYVSLMLFDKKNVEGFQDKEVDNFELIMIFCYQDANFQNNFFKALDFFLKNNFSIFSNEHEIFLYSTENTSRITKNSFEKIQSIVKKINFIKDSEVEYKPANSKAQEMIDFIKRVKKNKPTPKEKINLKSIISGLSWKSNGINIKDIFDITIYQLYDGFFSTENIDNYYHTFTGIYSGNIDAKKLDMSNFHWAKIIDN